MNPVPPPDPLPPPPIDFFPSTHWSLIRDVRQPDDAQAKEALGRLLQRYQTPLTSYIRRKFLTAEQDAADLFQGFVERSVLSRLLIHKAQQIPGRQFRSYLLTALHRFVVSEHRRSQAAVRRPPDGWETLPETDTGIDLECATKEGATASFDLAWARAVLQQALDRMKAECAANGRSEVWELFEHRLLNPILHGIEPVSYEELQRRFEWESPAQAHNLLVTAKRTFIRSLRSVVSEYVARAGDIDMEVRELQLLLSQAGS